MFSHNAPWCIMCIRKWQQNTTSITGEILTKFCSTTKTGNYILSWPNAVGVVVSLGFRFVVQQLLQQIHNKWNQWTLSLQLLPTSSRPTCKLQYGVSGSTLVCCAMNHFTCVGIISFFVVCLSVTRRYCIETATHIELVFAYGLPST